MSTLTKEVDRLKINWQKFSLLVFLGIVCATLHPSIRDRLLKKSELWAEIDIICP